MTASEYRYIQAIETVAKEKGKVIMTDVAQKLAYARASSIKSSCLSSSRAMWQKKTASISELQKKDMTSTKP